MNTWINFKELRQALDFEHVLQHYKIEIKRKGDQHMGFCPLPNHDGERRSPSFSANLARGIFQCFGCQAKGNLLDFAALMEGVNPEDGKAMRGVALKLQNVFGLARSQPPVATKPAKAAPTEPQRVSQALTDTPKVALINPPLDFELKGLDPAHPYLHQRGIRADTATYFGVGVCSRGSLQGRLAIGLHNEASNLIGYAGRVIDDSTVTADNPRYRFPGPREREGVKHEFRKNLLLYNFHRLVGPVDNLILVEGFVSVWWLHQCGHPNVVATMGSGCSDYQAELVVSVVNPRGRVWIMSDGDAAGAKGATEALKQIAPYRFVRWIALEDGKQPTDLSADEFKEWF